MYSSQIENILSNDKYARRIFCGVFPCDLLPLSKPIDSVAPKAYVVNSKPSDHRGEHWLVMYFENLHCEFFNSYGLGPPDDGPIRRFIDLNCNTLSYNRTQLQSLLSKVCGIYCCVYIMKKARGENINSIFYYGNELRPDLNDKRVMGQLQRLMKTYSF